MATNSQKLPITITPLPSVPIITGDNEVCLNHNSIFKVNPNKSITEYLWNYSGNGNILYSNKDEISIDFNRIESTGYLTVTGINRCGSSELSSPFPMSVNLCDLHIPNTFSPNNDGVNELFVIRGLPENSYLVVFDRLGQIYYESNNYQNDWNGIDKNGKYLTADTYWYTLSIEGISADYKGFIYLKR